MTHARHTLAFRRKREGKTNYKKRLALLKSGKRRLVVRVSNKHVLLQLVEYQPAGDKVLVTVSSKALLKHGWSHSTKSTPAAFFTGHLFAKTAKQHKITEAIVDLGLEKHHPGSRACAAIYGVVEGGLSIPVGEDIFPSPDRIRGEHLSSMKPGEVAAVAAKLGVKLPEGHAPKKEKKADEPKGKGDKGPTLKKVVAEQRPDKAPHADKKSGKKKGE